MADKNLNLSSVVQIDGISYNVHAKTAESADSAKNAEKLGNKDANAYQEKLTSGTNIKTINNVSLLGSGNIDITGSGVSLGDMLKSVYDTNGDGTVDNADKLGGVAAGNYAKKSDIPSITVSQNEPTGGAAGAIWFKY